ncbi:hypothetical protein BJQ94_15730 [Cryobacterium sp. SO2]|uniref:hypothetical protein n=1 Tax=Cryobacterium sp. SO2 TaxID=1897060 RepID=UPI00223DD08F|nr:hypothetical protein [Cryobacterium sp. SO2]WEO76790.1 hypothetical protein BJQ94_15730 [Cryobacterium sp. SO2]
MSHSVADTQVNTGRNSRGVILLTIGVVLTVTAMTVLAVLLLLLSSLQSDALARINEENLSYRAEFGFVERQLSAVSALVALPAILLVTATCFLIPGYLRRRATTIGRGTSTTATSLPLPLGVHAAWALAPLTGWVLLVLRPLLNLLGGTAWPAGLRYENADAVWLMLAAYGGLSSALFVTILVSLLKKVVYVRHITAQPSDVDGSAAQGIWRWVTFRWRFDLWLAGIGGVFVGLCWIALGFGDTPFFLSTLAIGLVLVASGVLLAVNYWRAGEPLGAGESYA